MEKVLTSARRPYSRRRGLSRGGFILGILFFVGVVVLVGVGFVTLKGMMTSDKAMPVRQTVIDGVLNAVNKKDIADNKKRASSARFRTLFSYQPYAQPSHSS